jgi:hypothetical protein
VPSKHWNVRTKLRSVTSQRTWIFSYWYPGYSKLWSIHQLAATGDTELLSAVYKGPRLLDIPNILRTKLLLACFFQPHPFLKHNYSYNSTNYCTLTWRTKCMLSESLSVATTNTNWQTHYVRVNTSHTDKFQWIMTVDDSTNTILYTAAYTIWTM